MSPAATVSLPADLAPALRERCLRLLEQVGLAAAHPDQVLDSVATHRCTVCRRRGGKMGGHHEGSRVVWVHRRCHRRLHVRRNATGRCSR